MSASNNRLKIAASIVDFEARRDANGHLRVYMLPEGDGGGKYEVAGINERFHPVEAARLRDLVQGGNFDEAEQFAREYIAAFTDVADRWTRYVPLESYLRDCVFNRGPGGAARILQIAVGVKVDGGVGQITKAAVREAEGDPAALLDQLRAAREHYERDWVGRDESSKFWAGLVNRWNKSLAFARTFLNEPPEAEAVSEESTPKPLDLPGGLPDGDEKVDSRSEKNIATLHERVRPLARRLVRMAAAKGIIIKVISGTRSYEEQAELYKKHLAGGPQAAPPGHSNHNFGLAFDVGVFDGDADPEKAKNYLGESSAYLAIGPWAPSIGLTWGGTWKKKDYPHYELRPEWAAKLSEEDMIHGLASRKEKGIDAFAKA